MKVIILIIAVLICQSNSLFLPVTGRPVCITIAEEAEKEVHFFYEVTGNDPDKMSITFHSLTKNTQPFTLNGQSGKTTFRDSQMKVCFVSTDGGYKSVSIDFYPQETAHLAQLASKGDLYELHSKLISVGEKIKEGNRN